MQAEHVADFRALRVVARAAGETFQFDGGFRMRFGQLPGRDLRAEAIEKLDQDFEIRIHSSC